MENDLQKATESIKHAIALLREKDVKSTLVERLFLLDDAWERYKHEPQPIIQGKGLYDVLSQATLPIEPYDLLLGRYVDRVPTEEEEARLQVLWQNSRDRENPIVCYNGGHATLDWSGMVRIGIPGYIAMTEERLRRAEQEGASRAVMDKLEGMQRVYRAVYRYIERYAEAAEAAGEQEMAEVCRALLAHAPATFRQALQLELFVFTVYIIYAGCWVACLCFGRIDDDLLPLYQADLAAGRLTREEAGALIDDFSAKCSLHLGRGEHQMADSAYGGNTTGWERNNAYDSPTYLLLGGYSNAHDHVTNPLTRLWVEHIHPQLKNPVIVFRSTKDTDPTLFALVCDQIRQNASILLYNDETVIPAYLHSGIPMEDARNYSVHPCNWADVGGGGAIVGVIGGSMPRMLMELLERKTDFDSMNSLYDALAEQFAASIRPVFAEHRRVWRSGPMPVSGILSLTDCFYPNTIESAQGGIDGGVKYPALWALLRNVGTATDMLSAIDTLVFKDHFCTLSELMKACASDFEGYEDLWLRARRAPKYGQDDDRADAHGRRILNTLLDVIDREAINEKGERDVLTLNVTIADMWHIGEGEQMGATPDGRHAHAPLSENLSPTVGANQITATESQSVTALLNSVSSMPFERMHSGALNVRLRRDAVRGPEGLARLVALLEAYLENGGMQIQVSIADTEELKEAQRCPECHTDLTVRITGYSAVFTDMSRNAQDEIIRREELS